MKRVGGLWPQIIDWENLTAACREAARGKRGRLDVARFLLNWEPQLLELQADLTAGRYRHGPYRQFTIYERKPRVISAAGFRDRVVHHALMRVVGPILDRRMIFHSYACRPGKGVHAAVDYFQRCQRQFPWVLRMDVRRCV